MPVYEYQVVPGEEGCEGCTGGFEILQHMKDDSLAVCPRCGAPIQRLVQMVGIATPKTNSELKNLGFTKLVRREEGVYENVTRTGDEARYMERDKPGTIPDIHKKISD